MDIACSTDSQYVVPTGIMLTSLFFNNRDADVCVHLLHNGISGEQQKLLADIAAKNGGKIVFYDVDENYVDAYPIGIAGQNPHVGSSRATYYRLHLAELLPASVNRVIYLDGDIIVTGSLASLWRMDMDGKAVAAVPDSYNNIPDHYNRLRYPQSLGYFNAGVLLINLDHWRSRHLSQAFHDYASANAAVLKCHDQDIMNYVLRHDKVVLPLKYNMLNEYWFDTRYSVVSWELGDEMLEGQRNPVIVHFTGIPKPWYVNCHHPMKREFERYRAMTPWRGMRERRWMPLRYCVEKAAVRLVVRIGLRPKEYVPENRYIVL